MNPNYANIGNQYQDTLFSLKKRQLAALITEIQHQIQERQKIKENNLYCIEKDICSIDTKIMQTQQFSYNSKDCKLLENKLVDLEKEKREQTTLFWQDTCNLQKTLTYTIIEYEKIKQREQTL